MSSRNNSIRVLLLCILLPTLLFGCSGDPDKRIAQKIVDFNQNQYADREASGEIIDGVRVIEIKAYQFYFEPTEIIVNKGEKIKLIVHSMDIPHGFEIEGFEIEGYDINTVIRKGSPLEIEFVADEAGIWEFICTIYCGFGHSDMKGVFAVR